MTIFSATGAFNRSYHVSRIAETTAPNILGQLQSEMLVVSAAMAPSSQGARTESTVVLYTVGAGGRVLDRLGEYLDRKLGSNGLALGFGSSALFGVASTMVWYGHNSRFELQGTTRGSCVELYASFTRRIR